MKKICLITPCYNEESNIAELYRRTSAVFAQLSNYQWEWLFIDNASQDRTVEKVKELIKLDPRLKLIVNARNFGHIRSPFHAVLQSDSDAIVLMASDLQTPPEMMLDFVKGWEEGFHSVIAVKATSAERGPYYWLRKLYYRIVTALSDIELVQGFDGFGLFDKAVVDAIKKMADPYPYFRGIVCEAGFNRKEIPFNQPLRKRGISSNNFYTLYDIAMLGIINHSKIPLRLAIIVGFVLAFLSFLVACGYLVYKLLNWDSFALGVAPAVIGLFLMISVQLIFMGIFGEYLGAIHDLTKNRPHVIEKERVNF